MDVLRRWKRAIWKQQPWMKSLFIHRLMYPSLKYNIKTLVRDWIIGMMLTFNEVALYCVPLAVTNAQKQNFSPRVLCSNVNQTDLQVLDMTPAQRSCVHWLAVLCKHIHHFQAFHLSDVRLGHLPPLFLHAKVSATTKWKQLKSKWWRI